MQVLDITEVQLEWTDLDRLTYHERQPEVRAPGLHVSQVLREIAVKGGMYSNEDRDDDMPLRVMLGLAFEEMAARLYSNLDWQPGQVEWDGVIGSPDGITMDDNSLDFVRGVSQRVYWVDEFKYTGKSQRVKGGKADELKDIRTEWMWMQQGMSYVNLLRRTWPERFGRMNKCRFHICWKYGNYCFPMNERYVRYLVEYTEAELRGNWAMLMAAKGEVRL